MIAVLSILVLLLAAALINAKNQERQGAARPPAATTTTSSPPAADTPPTMNVPGSTAVTSSCAVSGGLITRECAVIVPPDLPAGTKLPVVVLLHGFTDGPGQVRDSGRWTEAVLERRFMLVTPAGIAGSWNAGACCGVAQATNVDDTSYLAGLILTISQRSDVDPSRIFLAGFSNGGMMTYRFACVSDQVAAIASVSGTRVITCNPKRPLPIMHVHGTADDTVPYNGGAGLAAAIMGVTFPPVPATMDAVAAGDGCTAPPTETVDGTVTTKVWEGCGNGAEVKFVTLAGGGHNWPLGGNFDGTHEVLNFFGIR